jgi:hypothetical protein
VVGYHDSKFVPAVKTQEQLEQEKAAAEHAFKKSNPASALKNELKAEGVAVEINNEEAWYDVDLWSGGMSMKDISSEIVTFGGWEEGYEWGYNPNGFLTKTGFMSKEDNLLPEPTSGPQPGGEVYKLMTHLAEIEAQAKENLRAKLRGFGAQCFFCENISTFAKYNVERLLSRISGPNPERAPGWTSSGFARGIESTEPATTFSNLNTDRKSLNFNRGTPAELSNIIPFIKIYKIWPDGSETQVPFTTKVEDGFKDTTAILKGRKGRSADVGLESFDWEFLPGHPSVSGGRKVKASIKLIFENPESLLAPRFGPSSSKEKKQKYFRYIDLLNLAGISGRKVPEGERGQEVFDPDNFKIRVVVGYNVTPRAGRALPPSPFFAAAKEAKTSMLLAMYDYDLDFQEDGRLGVSIQYTGATESNIATHKFDIFDKNPKALAAIKALEAMQSKYRDNPRKREGLQAKMTDSAATAQNEIYGDFQKRLWKRAIHVDVPDVELERYFISRQQRPPHSDVQYTVKLDTSMFKETFELSGEPGKGHSRISMISFGDILDAMVRESIVSDSLKEINASFLLGQIIMPNPDYFPGAKVSKSVAINIGDIPISYHLFNDFFLKNVVKKLETSVSLHEFIMRMMNSLFMAAMGTACKFSDASTRTTKLAVSYLEMDTSDSNAKAILGKSNGRIVINKKQNYFIKSNIVATPVKKNRRHTFIFLHAVDGAEIFGTGKESVDIKRGVTHYQMAKDSGVLRNITFKKLPIKRGLQILQQGTDAIADPTVRFRQRLFAVWNANMDFIGNPYIKPYTVIYIDPTMPGMGDMRKKNSFSNIARIGGYHTVLTTEHSFSNGEWETKVESVWKANPNDAVDKNPVRVGIGSGDLSSAKVDAAEHIANEETQQASMPEGATTPGSVPEGENQSLAPGYEDHAAGQSVPGPESANNPNAMSSTPGGGPGGTSSVKKSGGGASGTW